MAHESTFFLAFFLVTVLVNLSAIIVLFFYRRLKHRNLKIVIFSLLVTHVLFAINQVTRAFVSPNTNSPVSDHISGFTCLMSCIQMTILCLQCLVNATSVLRERFGKRIYSFTVVCVFSSWLVGLILVLPLICIEASQSHTSEQLDRYFQGIMVLILIDIILFLCLEVYVAYRTWINVDITNIINFSVNRRSVTMAITSSIIVVVSWLPFIASSLKLSVNKSMMEWFLWLDKISVPILFMSIYTVKHFSGVVKRTLINRQQTFRQISSSRGETQGGVTVINSFTHVQPVTNLMSSEVVDAVGNTQHNITVCTEDGADNSQRNLTIDDEDGIENPHYGIETPPHCDGREYPRENESMGTRKNDYEEKNSNLEIKANHFSYEKDIASYEIEDPNSEFPNEHLQYDIETVVPSAEFDDENHHQEQIVLSLEDVSVSYV